MPIWTANCLSANLVVRDEVKQDNVNTVPKVRLPCGKKLWTRYRRSPFRCCARFSGVFPSFYLMPNNSITTPQLTSRLPNVGTTIFSVMSRLAAEHGAVDLGQGFPSFDPPEELRQLVAQAMNEGHNQYAPMAGVAALREAISGKMQLLYGTYYQPESEITVTSGATQALMTAILASASAGDEVIVLQPAYDLYLPAIQVAGAKPVVVQLTAPDENHSVYRVDWQKVKDAITARTRVLILNFPHNPTGAVLHEPDLDELENLTSGTPIVVISDEVYEHIVFDGQPHLSMASRPALAARSFVVSSFGKTLHMTGWKIGYCCAPASLMHEFRKIHQFMVYAICTPMQVALGTYMSKSAAYTGLSAFYQARRDYLTENLSKTRLKPLPSPGTFFLLADYRAISSVPQDEFARWLTVEHGVTTIPVSAFHGDPERLQGPDAPKLVRLCFAKHQKTLDDALERLAKI